MKGNASSGTESGASQFPKSVSVDAPGSSGDLTGKAKEAAQDIARAAASQASEFASSVGSELSAAADEQKQYGADVMQGFAKAARGAADEMEEQSPTVARYVRRAAASVEELSGTVRSRNMNDLVAAATDTARARPLTFFVGAMAAGFAIARFLKSGTDATGTGASARQSQNRTGDLARRGPESTGRLS
jgi:hypothetical protein